MTIGRVAFVGSLLLLAPPSPAHPQGEEAGAIRQFDLRTIGQLGEEIHRADQYASRATDIVFAQDLDLSTYPIVGWVVTRHDGAPLVLFIGNYDEGPRGVFEVRPTSSPDAAFKAVERRELTGEEQIRFAARQTAIGAIEHRCSQQYNTVVLPDPESDSWLVYLLSATARHGEIVAGGHYRFTVSADGSTVERADRLYRSCLRIPRHPPQGALPDGARPIMPAMTHVVSDTPIETHVFLSLLHETDLAVGIGPEDIWKVSGASITRMQR